MGERSPKSLKLETNFIPEKGKKSPWDTQRLSTITVTTARDRTYVAVAMGAGFGPLFIVKSTPGVGQRAFAILRSGLKLEVILNVALHFKFHNFWL